MEIKGVSIDSRNINEGELFIAIKGERFDGHDFVSDALKKGAWGALVERTVLEKNFGSLGGLKNILPVEDTLYALQEMSYMHRKKFAIPVIGITGSNGKTTTKEMLAEILKQKGAVLKNEGNLNNHIGVPLTLIKLNKKHKAAIIEMGMSAPGEIDMLARLSSPTIGVITNIGPAHLEFLGSLDMIAQVKGELLSNIRADGITVLNADDKYFGYLKNKFHGRTIAFGIENKADVQALDIQQGEDFIDFSLAAEGSKKEIRLRALGRHNVYNALAAAAAAIAADMPIDAIKYGLDDFSPIAMRSEIKQLQGRTILADYYNANPASMEAALRALMSIKTSNKTIAVLGDMLELGKYSLEAHREIGKSAVRLGVDIVIVMGQFSANVAEGAIEEGMPKERVFATNTHKEAATLIRHLSRPGDVVLIKGSRGMKMEKILEEF
ncbi:MAG TPA: UDP-N-acetylmuramoyl-tripeptide--D-alanyl-D-alanine ligase [Nitrospirota bacterium]|nr:UDP-N-acetylmuramoyl-tripeptide--D-alanyl-D-alanine ligase [Nitrospirota bacterium]